MKIIVDNPPTNPKECLFACENKKQGRVNSKTELSWSEFTCNIDNKLCDFNKGHKCNKLKTILFGW